MKDKGGSFDMRKDPDAEDVHQDGNQEYHPIKHCPVPAQWLVIFDVQDYQSLDHLTCYKGSTSANRQSCEDGDPA